MITKCKKCKRPISYDLADLLSGNAPVIMVEVSSESMQKNLCLECYKKRITA